MCQKLLDLEKMFVCFFSLSLSRSMKCNHGPKIPTMAFLFLFGYDCLVDFLCAVVDF